ncbi:hypothetical protein Tco_0334086, partial [Tanacetum coccineum]
VASSGWPLVSAVLGQITHLVASLTLDSASWGDNISPDSFLPSILLLLVIIVAVDIVVVANCALLLDPLTSGLWKWLPSKFEALKR